MILRVQLFEKLLGLVASSTTNNPEIQGFTNHVLSKASLTGLSSRL